MRYEIYTVLAICQLGLISVTLIKIQKALEKLSRTFRQ